MENPNELPTISIVGRPNVGKSSVFNCLLGERKAVVVEQSGTTRDRVESFVDIGGAKARLIDTGGYMAGDKDRFSHEIQQQIFSAMEEAELILVVVDAMAGMTPMDTEIAFLLRKYSKNILLVANKVDNARIESGISEFYTLGLGEPMPISALHKRGVQSLKKHIRKIMGAASGRPAVKKDTRYIKIAVVGRPNVGKSSFVNALLKKKRFIVSEVPGTTRDSMDTYFKYDDTDYILIDTAGIRHRKKVKEPVDSYSMMRSRDAIERADVAFLLIDAAEGMTRDDTGILNFIEEQGKACLVLINKWDLAAGVDDVDQDGYKDHLLEENSKLEKYPLLYASAKKDYNVLESLAIAKELDTSLNMKVPTPALNKVFEKRDPGQVPVPRRDKRPNFLYIVQTGTRPISFDYFVNDPAWVSPAHLSFIENQLRSNFPLKGLPVRINLKRSRKERK
ncbi:MAG: ribosome biogenesis GTPase Der [Candidatus Omnitrophica bacterium]|nr:ribosome biogenesis GTPase Der [Candidatus Omnitrophota bacterium]MDD5487454.1 ribosome biogenesis GTPase Der [Candidatus Omnitrophota bacterium]